MMYNRANLHFQLFLYRTYPPLFSLRQIQPPTFILNFLCKSDLCIAICSTLRTMHFVCPVPMWSIWFLKLAEIISVNSPSQKSLCNGQALCFLGGRNWIFKCYLDEFVVRSVSVSYKRRFNNYVYSLSDATDTTLIILVSLTNMACWILNFSLNLACI